MGKTLKKNDVVKLDGVNYTLIENIGDGGSGTVWRVQSDGQNYAAKFLQSDENDKVVRFEKEIIFCQESKHKNIVRIISSGLYKNRVCYVMPFYSKTFRDIINNETDIDSLMKYILKLCRAINYIHRKGVFHRDIKPENILINGSDLVLADFGIAQFKDNAITAPNRWLGNRNYMAPEQKIRKNAKNICKAADVYALGLLINECFTKENPSGSDFKLIANNYPLLSDLDVLVENMIRQKPEDRFTIDIVVSELSFFYNKLKNRISDVNFSLRQGEYPNRLNRVIYNKILKRASEDILTGEYFFQNFSYEKLNQFNLSWHRNIGYSVDNCLFNLYVQERLFYLCKSKFEYEGNRYGKKHGYISLNLDNNEDHISLYNQMVNILEKYSLQNCPERLIDLTGQILKYFSSCADYHCQEILNNIVDIELLATENLKSAPILHIVSYLKQGVEQNMVHLLKRFNGLGGKYEFVFPDYISINWNHTQYAIDDEDIDDILDNSYHEEREKINAILKEFENQWNVKTTRIDENYFSVKFPTYTKFQKFRSYALNMAEPHYIFEGDVMDIFREPVYNAGMVELKLGRVFDIPNTIAKIIGL